MLYSVGFVIKFAEGLGYQDSLKVVTLLCDFNNPAAEVQEIQYVTSQFVKVRCAFLTRFPVIILTVVCGSLFFCLLSVGAIDGKC